MPNGPSTEIIHPMIIIDDILFIECVIQSPPTQSILSRPHSNAEKAGQGVIILYRPKYIFLPPQSAPQRAQRRETVRRHPGMLFPTLLTLVYIAIKPAQQCPDPALPSGTLGRLSNLPAHPKDPITNPNQPWHPGSATFFTVFWLVGFCPYRCMM